MNRIPPRSFFPRHFQVLGLALLGAAAALAAPPQNAALLAPGDSASEPPIGAQQHPWIAAGGGNYLAVWDDARAVFGSVNTDQPLTGNQTDIYGMRLDANGNPLDATPIVICNLGRNQTRPRVSWNGQNWLVVFVSERPDWYFFEDIVGVRVAPDGTVLDSTPIPIRLEQNSPANYYGTNPYVTSDGTNWIAVWEDWDPATFKPNVKGTRIAPDGTVLDPTWPVLYQYNVAAFGPREPRIEPGNGELLLTWRDATGSPVQGRRISNALVPLAAPFTITTASASGPVCLASSGTMWFVVNGLKGYRIGAGGALLDPTGITLPIAGFLTNPLGLAATFNGSNFVFSYSATPSGGGDANCNMIRIATSGTILDASPIVYAGSSADEFQPAIAGANGRTEAIYSWRGTNPLTIDDMKSSAIDANGNPAAAVGVSDGRPRQEYAHVTTAGNTLLSVYTSRTSQATRVLAQRFNADGTAIDANPVVVRNGGPNEFYKPQCAWNGSTFLVGYVDSTQGVVVRRYDANLNPLDASPIQVFATGTTIAVGANGGDFLVAATYTVSGNLSFLHAKRVRGSDGAILDATALEVFGNFTERTNIVELAGQWLVVSTRRATHDSPATATWARFVDVFGTMGPQIQVSGPGYGFWSDVAVMGDRALVVYDDDSNFNGDRIEGRLIDSGGGLLTNEFVIADADRKQMFPTVSSDGYHFLVGWVDYRSNIVSSFQVDQLRGDLYATRVTQNGDVLDPNGVQLISTPTPEDLPDLASANGLTTIFYSGLGTAGTVQDTPRLSILRVDTAVPSPWKDLGFALPGALGAPHLAGFGDALIGTPSAIVLTNGKALSPAFLFLGGSQVNLPLLGGTLVPAPAIIVPLATDGLGGLSLATPFPGGPSGVNAYLQIWIADPTGLFGATASNGLKLTLP